MPPVKNQKKIAGRVKAIISVERIDGTRCGLMVFSGNFSKMKTPYLPLWDNSCPIH